MIESAKKDKETVVVRFVGSKHGLQFQTEAQMKDEIAQAKDRTARDAVLIELDQYLKDNPLP